MVLNPVLLGSVEWCGTLLHIDYVDLSIIKFCSESIEWSRIPFFVDSIEWFGTMFRWGSVEYHLRHLDFVE